MGFLITTCLECDVSNMWPSFQWRPSRSSSHCCQWPAWPGTLSRIHGAWTVAIVAIFESCFLAFEGAKIWRRTGSISSIMTGFEHEITSDFYWACNGKNLLAHSDSQRELKISSFHITATWREKAWFGLAIGRQSICKRGGRSSYGSHDCIWCTVVSDS